MVRIHNYDLWWSKYHDLHSKFDCYHVLTHYSVNLHYDSAWRDDDCSLHIHDSDNGNRDHNWSDIDDYRGPNSNFDVYRYDEGHFDECVYRDGSFGA